MGKHIDLNLIKKFTRPKIKKVPKLGKSFKTMKCDSPGCGRIVKVDANAINVICHVCTCRMIGSTIKTTPKIDPELQKAKKALIAKRKAEKEAHRKKFADFPKGWWFKAMYTHKDGRKFQYGKKVDKFTVKLKEKPKPSGRPRRLAFT